ncbi:hypothetical protein SSPO_038040 [Streptomyces antimycoticus]|uniref:Uncharacterized protein n=1 Tax=Streptomyces antimycoticus TaxID=68175 RepID=A0A499UXN8_9ACTN|nr:hypothetical protein SSPO_038040 [Streptomyces antimycoticus]
MRGRLPAEPPEQGVGEGTRGGDGRGLTARIGHPAAPGSAGGASTHRIASPTAMSAPKASAASGCRTPCHSVHTSATTASAPAAP